MNDMSPFAPEARRIGYVIFIKEEERDKGRVTKERRLYFGPSDAKHPGVRLTTFELRWGVSLIDFKPTLTTANQVNSVTVKGWDRSTKQPIAGRASLDDRKFGLNRDLLKLLESSDAREEQVVDKPVFTQKEADELARAPLVRQPMAQERAAAWCAPRGSLRYGLW